MKELVDRGVLARPMDGNHGEIHPTSDDFVGRGIPFVTASDLRGGRLDLQGCKFISEKRARELRKGFSEEGDVLLSHKATLGRVALVPSLDTPFIVLTPQVTYYRILDKEAMDGRYLRFYLDSPGFQNSLLAHATGSTRGYISITRQNPLPIVVPPFAEQRRIAAVLGALDDKIELNRKMNRTLEEMAQAIFKSWFIDFDGVPESEMVESELGPIPRGWSVGSFGDVAYQHRQTVRPGEVDPDTPYIGLADMPQGSIALDDWGRASDATSAKVSFEKGDLLFGKLRPYFKKVGVAPSDGVCSSDIVVIRPKSKDLGGFALGTLTSDSFINYSTAVATGTRMPRVSWKAMSKYPVALPPAPLARRFTNLMAAILDKIRAEIWQSRNLANLRDTLLPKLISGEVRVPRSAPRGEHHLE